MRVSDRTGRAVRRQNHWTPPTVTPTPAQSAEDNESDNNDYDSDDESSAAAPRITCFFPIHVPPEELEFDGLDIVSSTSNDRTYIPPDIVRRLVNDGDLTCILS